MNLRLVAAAACSVVACSAAAQDSAFEWEGELEIGVESVVDSDTPGNEIADGFATLELGGTVALGASSRIFFTLVGESVTDAVDDRAFEDIGLYLEELGVAFDVGAGTTIALGKANPTFGRRWDDAAGYFSDVIAEDYELVEQIGVFIDSELVPGGTLSFGAFYADNTALSRSLGTDRGRTSTADGGAGNTGEIDNFTLAWTQEFDASSVQVGIRHLSAGTGDAGDDTGIVVSATHAFSEQFYVFGEVARFSQFGGGPDDASFVTLNSGYTVDAWTFSLTAAHRDLDAGGKTDAFSIAAEYEFDNGNVLGGGLLFTDEDGDAETTLGISLIVPFGA